MPFGEKRNPPLKKILIVRFSSIGDIVLTTPVLRCLKLQLGAELHFLTKKAYRELLVANPHLDRIWTIERRVSEVLPALRKERFDLVVDLHRNLRSLQLKWHLRRPSVSFQKLNWEKWLMVRFKIDRLPDRHIVDRYLDAVRSYGVQYDGQGLDHFIPPEQEVDLAAALGLHEPFTAFAIGAAHATKRLPADKILAVCRRLPGPVVLLGGPGEQAVGRSVAEQLGDRVHDTCGRLSLQQSASVVRQAQVVISHDTGLMHLAAALRRPVVSVWGNTIPAFGMYPFFPAGIAQQVVVEVEGLACRPCSKIGYEACPRGHFRCMREISEEAIERAVTGFRKA